MSGPPSTVHIRRSWRAGFAATLISICVLSVACSSTTGSDNAPTAPIRSFWAIQVGEASFAADPSDPTRAVFHVETSIPMICALVWGETDQYGRFNNSATMNGTGIAQHDVVLPDVTIGATYKYVIEGVTADGSIYRSDQGTFTISSSGLPPSQPSAGRNLLGGARVIETSSEYSASFAGKNAIDGNTATEWSSKGEGNGVFITIELAATERIGTVGFLTRSMRDGTAKTETYTVSIDDGPALGPFPAGTPSQTLPAQIDSVGRRLRFVVAASTGGNVGAIEIYVQGPN